MKYYMVVRPTSTSLSSCDNGNFLYVNLTELSISRIERLSDIEYKFLLDEIGNWAICTFTPSEFEYILNIIG